MIRIIADNITSPLGYTTQENLQRVFSGDTELTHYEGKWGMPEDFTASLFNEEQWGRLCVSGLTRFESLVYHSVIEALSHTDEDVLNANTCLIVSTTKANVEMLDEENYGDFYPAESARRLASKLGLKTEPIVVCNACISGVAAQVLAKRLLDSGVYDYTIVTGCDVQSKFIVSGFQSLKALSTVSCRPFDIERLGLNLGEASATMVLASDQKQNTEGLWTLQAGSISNDANHITTPSSKGVGSAAAMRAVLKGASTKTLAFINTHGTATMYNDQMESKAIESLGLSDVPVNALKGYYGHTMGAAGLLETVLSLHALDEGVIPATKGFEEIGVSGHINISNEIRKSSGNSFVKIISGFGGCNGAVLYTKTPVCDKTHDDYSETCAAMSAYETTHRLTITPDAITLDGEVLETEGKGSSMLTKAYKKYVGDYPKFYKMDILAKLGFLASELLLQKEGNARFIERSDRAVILFNHSSSICADREYQKSISSADEYFPSPSVFVYTLPNIVTGEIAIRNKYHGETSFYILAEKSSEEMNKVIAASFLSAETNSMLTGWISADSKEHFEIELSIIQK